MSCLWACSLLLQACAAFAPAWHQGWPCCLQLAECGAIRPEGSADSVALDAWRPSCLHLRYVPADCIARPGMQQPCSAQLPLTCTCARCSFCLGLTLLYAGTFCATAARAPTRCSTETAARASCFCAASSVVHRARLRPSRLVSWPGHPGARSQGRERSAPDQQHQHLCCTGAWACSFLLSRNRRHESHLLTIMRFMSGQRCRGERLRTPSTRMPCKVYFMEKGFQGGMHGPHAFVTVRKDSLRPAAGTRAF